MGIRTYKLGKERLTHDFDEVEIAQERLVADGFPVDVDGNVGPGTLRAIEQWESAYDKDFYATVVLPQKYVTMSERKVLAEDDMDEVRGDDEVMIPNVAHVAQGAFEIDLGPNDPCRKSGCLSCCCAIVLSVRDNAPVDVPDFIYGLKARRGYNERAQIVWGVLEGWKGLKREDNIDTDSACEHIESGTPVMVDIGGHWVLAIGYDGYGFHCHDVGYRAGNGYENPGRTEGKPTTYVPWKRALRCMVLI